MNNLSNLDLFVSFCVLDKSVIELGKRDVEAGACLKCGNYVIITVHTPSKIAAKRSSYTYL